MSEEIKQPASVTENVVFQLDSDRRREINDVKDRMESFLKEQLKLENKMELMLVQQGQLKERFEFGVSKTLTETSKKVDELMVAFGEVKAEMKNKKEAEAKEDVALEKRLNSFDGRLDTLYKGSIGVVLVAALLWIARLLFTANGMIKP
jgi:hypothetical protein